MNDDEIKVRLPSEKKESYKVLATASGMSLSEWVLSRCDETDEEREKRISPPLTIGEAIKTPAQAREAVKKVRPKEDQDRLVSGWKQIVPLGSLLKK